jgi:heme exporter protein D
MGPETAPESGLFNVHERKRIIMLSVLVIVVFGMVLYGWYDSTATIEREVAQTDAAEDRPAEVVVITPEVDVAKLKELVDDDTTDGQLVIEGAALEAIFEPARLLNDGHFDPMGGAELDDRILSELDAPLARGGLFRVRGVIEELGTFEGGGGTTAHYRGLLRLEGDYGAQVWFAVVALPDSGGSVGDFVRLDGLFLKSYRGATEGGDRVTGPLLVGPRVVQSFPALDPVVELDRNALRFVEDDGVDGIHPQPFYEYWRLISYAQNVDPESIDWSEAARLDGELIREIAHDGGPWRGEPIVFPPSQLFDIWDQAQGENPARLDKLAEAWAGNEYWARTTTGVIRIVAPFERGELRRGSAFTGRGFFLRNFAYERADGNLAIAPFFVMQSIEEFVPVEDETWGMVFTGIALGLVAILILAFVGVMRDRQKTQQLQAELRRRRRARRMAPRDPDEPLPGTQPSS